MSVILEAFEYIIFFALAYTSMVIGWLFCVLEISFMIMPDLLSCILYGLLLWLMSPCSSNRHGPLTIIFLLHGYCRPTVIRTGYLRVSLYLVILPCLLIRFYGLLLHYHGLSLFCLSSTLLLLWIY